MSTRKKTILKTIRIPEELDDLLQNDAKSKRTTVNALITTIMMRYAEWDRFADRFGVVSLSSDLFSALIEGCEEKEILRIAEEFGTRLPNEAMLFWFKRINVENFLRYLSLNTQYAKLGEYELEIDGKDYAISIHHDYGENWSKFIRGFFRNLLQNSLGLAPHFEITKNGVIITFRVP
jgi:hypothetical protein